MRYRMFGVIGCVEAAVGVESDLFVIITLNMIVSVLTRNTHR